MSKSIYKKALEILKNRVSKLHINHKIGNKDIAKLEILDIAKAIENHVIPIFEQALNELERLKKIEKLLELYKEYFEYSEMLKDGRKFGGRMLVEHERDKIIEEIKEIENE